MKKLYTIAGALLIAIAVCLSLWPNATIAAVRRAGTEIFTGKLALSSTAYLTRLRVGTGSTPGLTIDNDDAFIEGSLEVDGATRLDGGLSVSGNTIALPSSASALLYSTLTTNATGVANSVWGESNHLCFEGATANDYETCITLIDPTADREITWPNLAGTVLTQTGAAVILGGMTLTAPTSTSAVRIPLQNNQKLIGTGNISVETGVDTACTTTCGSATCIVGMNNATGESNLSAFVACASAAGDTCLCLTAE